jgi:hypothetical protein
MRRSDRKKLRKTFKIGDSVTWGCGAVARTVVEVRAHGVVVDVTEDKDAEWFAARQPDGRLFLFVSFDRNNRNRSGRGPIRHAVARR